MKLQTALVLGVFLFSWLAYAALEVSAGSVHVVVAQNGSGDFETVQQAVDHAPPYGNKRLVIEIRPGTYKERVTVPADRPRVTFLGSDAAITVITFGIVAVPEQTENVGRPGLMSCRVPKPPHSFPMLSSRAPTTGVLNRFTSNRSRGT